MVMMVDAMCQVCFEVKKCRTKYLGRPGEHVCCAMSCLAKNTARKQKLKETANAEKAAKKKVQDEEKAKARADRLLAKASARPANGRATKKPSKTKATARDAGFFQDPGDESDDRDAEEHVVASAAARMLEEVTTPTRSTPARKAAKPRRFIDEEARGSDSDGVEIEEDGLVTPVSMRDFVVGDHDSDEGASDACASAARGTPHVTPGSSIMVTPNSNVPTSVRPGMRRSRIAFSPGTPGSRPMPDSAFGRRPHARRRLQEEGEEEAEEEEEEDEVAEEEAQVAREEVPGEEVCVAASNP